MRVKLGSLGAALLVALAVSAAMATAAQATAQFTAEQYPAVLTGQSSESTNFIGFTCAEVSYEATLTAASTSITLTPHFGSCTKPFPFTIHMNGCHYLLEALTATTGEDTHGRLKVVCAAGKKITLTYGDCSAHIPPQTVGGTGNDVTLTNFGGANTSIGLDLNVESLHVETEGFILCKNTTHTNRQLIGTSTLSGYVDAGTQEHPTTTGRNRYVHGSPLDVHVKQWDGGADWSRSAQPAETNDAARAGRGPLRRSAFSTYGPLLPLASRSRWPMSGSP